MTTAINTAATSKQARELSELTEDELTRVSGGGDLNPPRVVHYNNNHTYLEFKLKEVLTGLKGVTMGDQKQKQDGSCEPAMLSDADIVSNTKSTGASTRSNELRDADLTVVTGGNRPRGSLGGLGVIYFPSL
jgi:hypothetical protein